MVERTFFSVQEFAELLGVTVPTVYKMLREGKLPYLRAGAGNFGTIRIHKDVIKLLTQRAMTVRPERDGRGGGKTKGSGNDKLRGRKRQQLDIFKDAPTPADEVSE